MFICDEKLFWSQFGTYYALAYLSAIIKDESFIWLTT